MKKTVLTIGFLIGFLCINNYGFGQLSLSYQYSSENRIGLGYNFSKSIWTELRLNGSSKIADITPALAVLYNISQNESRDIYIGLSGQVGNEFGNVALSIPIGLQFRPLEGFKKFSIIIEFQPTADVYNEDFLIRSFAGIRYSFGDDK